MKRMMTALTVAGLAVGLMGMMAVSVKADAGSRTAPEMYECLKRDQADRNNFDWIRLHPYSDMGHCYGQSREDWATTTPWAADHKWETLDTESQASGLNYGDLPFATQMVYHHPETSQKVCLSSSQAKRWGLESTDAIRPCDTWMW